VAQAILVGLRKRNVCLKTDNIFSVPCLAGRFAPLSQSETHILDFPKVTHLAMQA